MNVLNNILPTYHYQYFNTLNELQAKELNILQVFFRSAFGVYPETHLSNVVKKGYALSLSENFKLSPEKQKDLFALIAKASRLQGLAESYIPIGNEISLRYVIKNDNTLSAIDLQIFINSHQYDLTFFKNWDDKLVVQLPDLTEDSETSKENAIIQGLSSLNAHIITNLVGKLITHQVRTYTTNYHTLLNTVQKESMEKLGWAFYGDYEEHNASTSVEKRIYLMNRKEDPKAPSLAFAINSLTPQANEF